MSGREEELEPAGEEGESPEQSEAEKGAKIKTGRVSRTAGIGGLVAGQGLRWAGTRIANLTRDEEARQRRTEDRVTSIATQLAKQLGQMKGAAMKIGQVLSTIEMPGLSEEGQAEFRAALAELRDNAPKFDFADIRKVIEEDLGGKISDHFAEFDEQAVAAASIGQVHRARTHEGEDVAVKVQYPGVAEAVEIDLRNLGMLMRLLKRLAPGLDVKAVTAEIRERISEELDYELEAQNHREIERLFRGHPFAHVPRVITGLSSRRVLVTEFIEGLRFDDVCEREEDVRDRYAEIVFRFFLAVRERGGLALGDPHPGNYLLLEGGRVGFLDFGLVRRVDEEHLQGERDLARAMVEDDPDEVFRLMERLGYLPEPERFNGVDLRDQIATGAEWLIEPGVRRLDPDYARDLIDRSGTAKSPHYEAMKMQTMPPASILMRRQEGLIMVTMAQLRAAADWCGIWSEYVLGEPTATGIGDAEAAFFAERV